MDDFEIELKQDFLNEASELLVSAEDLFMRLEGNPDDLGIIDSIFRFAHNLKGTSRAVGFGQIAELTHVAENVLLKIKQGQIKVTPQDVDVLLRFNDKVAEMVAGLKDNLDATFIVEDLVTELAAVCNRKMEEGAKEKVTIQAEEAVSETKVIEVEEELEEEEAEEEKVIPLPQQIAPVVANPVKPVEAKRSDAKREEETIRVSLPRLEKLSDYVGELVILQSVVEQALGGQPSHLKTKRALTKLCKDIQEISMSLRMVPVGGAFQKLQRIVRDTSKALNKKVELHLIGEDTEIDRTVLEHLGDPLVHLIRNSVDHGIEEPQDRLLDGKPEIGIVEVLAMHEGNNLIIQITDDGKGMDPQSLVSKAIKKGILPEDKTLSDDEALNLIFAPGFSTKEVVSEVSGRGVGMDVVKTNIEALGGEIKLKSRKGAGSSIRLQLPLTLAIIEGMLVKVGDQNIILQRNQIHEINRLEKDSIHFAAGRVPYYKVRDEILPMFYLGQDLGLGNKQESIALIIRSGQKAFAVGIDDVIGQQQVVVKPPTKEILGKSGIMGTTILGDGRPALIIDLLDMYRKTDKRSPSKKTA